MNRREFIGGMAAAVASGAMGSSRPTNEIRAMLLHLGRNLWGESTAADHLRCEDAIWRECTELMAAKGFNMILIDLAEGLVYPSHPELAVKGSWSVERMRKELDRLRGMGLEPIPKLNFSTTHDLWLGEYHRMVSTKKYYEVCADVIRDVGEIFDTPRMMHIGFDEEDAPNQHILEYCVMRQGELWWHDFLWFVKETEKRGMRPWIWSDIVWHHEDEFFSRMPKSVIQSQWFYGPCCDREKSKKVPLFEKIDKAGFDQIPCGSNHGNETNIGELVRFCRKNLSKEHLKGFLMSSWYALMPDDEKRKNRTRNIRAIELAAEAFAQVEA